MTKQLLHWFFEIRNVIMHLILWKYGDYGCTFKSIQCGANSYTIKSDTEYKMDQSSIISYDINYINQPTSQTEFGCIINCDIGYIVTIHFQITGKFTVFVYLY